MKTRAFLFIFFLIFYLFFLPSKSFANWDSNSAVKLNGTGQYLTCTSNNCNQNLYINSDLTIDTWFNISGYKSSNEWAGIIAREGSYQLILRNTYNSNPSTAYLELNYNYNGVSQYIQVTPAFSENTWYQVSVVFKKTSPSSLNTKIFVNGIEVASKDLSGGNGFLDNNAGQLYLGKTRGNSSVTFPGSIDEVRISNVARYTTNFPKPISAYVNDSNTIALYHLSENSGSSAHDSSGNNIDLTLYGATWTNALDINNFITPNCYQGNNNQTLVVGPESDALLSYITNRVMQPGQTLILCDGIYQGAIYFINNRFVDSQTGVGNSVTVKAQNDGKAILDGAGIRSSIRNRKAGMIQMFYSSGISVEGIYARDCFDHQSELCSMVDIEKDSSYINLRRITGKRNRANGVGETDIMKIDGETNPDGTTKNRSHHILLEDNAVYGVGRLGIMITIQTNNITLRRFFSLAEGFNGVSTWCQNVEVYGGSNTLLENNIAFTNTSDPHPCHDTSTGSTYPFHGFILPGQNQKLLGSIVKDGTGNSFYVVGCSNCLLKDNVSINSYNATDSQYGFVAARSRFDTPIQNDLFDKNTWIQNLPPDKIQNGSGALYTSEYPDGSTNDSIEVKNSFFSSNNPGSFALNRSFQSYVLGQFYHSNNRFTSDFTTPYTSNLSPGSNESRLNPNWDTSTYGYGAYLMASRTSLAGQGENGSTIGADIIYKYENGNLTDNPLWPWPMEDRIKSETGISVTWASSGGLWKTLDGVYTSPTPSSTPTPSPKPGDANGDNLVDESDYTIWLNHYSQQLGGGASVGDFNGNGIVDGIDYTIWLNYYGK